MNREVYRNASVSALMSHSLAEVASGKRWSSCPALWYLCNKCGFNEFLTRLVESPIPFTLFACQQIYEMMVQRLDYTVGRRCMVAAIEKGAYDVCSWILSNSQIADRMCTPFLSIRKAAEVADPRFLMLLGKSAYYTRAYPRYPVFSDHVLIAHLARDQKMEHFKACMSVAVRETTPDGAVSYHMFSPRQAFLALLEMNNLPDDGVAFYKALRAKFPLEDFTSHARPKTNKVLNAIHGQEAKFSRYKTCIPASSRRALDVVRRDLSPFMGPDCANCVFMFTLDIVEPGLLQRTTAYVWQYRVGSVKCLRRKRQRPWV